MSDLSATYDRIAADWDKDHREDTWWIEDLERLLKLLPERARFLDYGCGPGHKSAYLVARGYPVLGIDFSQEMVRIAETSAPHARFKVADMRNPVNVDEQFDCIAAFASFLHLRKREVPGVLAHARRLLSPGGLIYIAVKERRPGQLEEKIESEADYGYEYSRFFSYYRAQELRSLVCRAGFNPEHEARMSSGRTEWLTIAARK